MRTRPCPTCHRSCYCAGLLTREEIDRRVAAVLAYDFLAGPRPKRRPWWRRLFKRKKPDACDRWSRQWCAWYDKNVKKGTP